MKNKKHRKIQIISGVLSLLLLFTACNSNQGNPVINGDAHINASGDAKPITANKDTMEVPLQKEPTTSMFPGKQENNNQTVPGVQDPFDNVDEEDIWVANCNEFIYLRENAKNGSTVLATILVGGKMQLLGWEGKFAKVSYEGQEGYVLSNYIKPSQESYIESQLTVVDATNTYTYEQMQADLQEIVRRFPNIVELDSIGTSELGRDIPVIRIGNEDAQYHVLVQAAIHGREHLTAWVAMTLVDDWVTNHRTEYQNICYHIIPMLNPDGVIVSQTATLTPEQLAIYQRDLALGNTTADQTTYARQWKANGVGLDLNRNFPSGWDIVVYHTEPSSQQYKGEQPFSAAESIALRDYTLSYDFDVTISYHATGSLIYYEYGNKQPVNDLSLSLGRAVREVSGYPLVGCGSLDGAGYKDWVMDELGIPSLTIEIGCGSAPLQKREIYSIFERNQDVLVAIARWITENQ